MSLGRNIDQVTVRPFLAGEWEVYKTVRLKALSCDPAMFGSNFDRENAFPDEKWQASLSDPDLGIFGVFHQDDVIGMAGTSVKRENLTDPVTVFWGLWLEKPWRGQGLSAPIYQALIGWVRQRPTLKRAVVSYREGNEASMKAVQKQGFTFTHTAPRTWHDGLTEPEYFYELNIN